MITIKLTEYEMHYAAHLGVARHIASLRDGRKDNHGFKGDPWDTDIEGACGELAVAKAFKMYWTPTINTFSAMDVGNYQVRKTAYPDGHLIIRPSDDDQHQFVLTTGQAPDIIVHGWILGRDAKKHDEWVRRDDNRPPAWFVPQSALTPIT